MSNKILAALVTAWVALVIPHSGRLEALPAVSAQAGVQAELDPYRAVVTKYCVTCHNDRRETGNLSLEKVDLRQVGANAEVLEKMLRKLRTDAMPPLGAPRPDKATVQSFVKDLESVLDRSGA